MKRMVKAIIFICLAVLCMPSVRAADGNVNIAAESSHTCLVTTSGGVMCWGLNDYGQLGDNTTTRRLTPVDVSSLSSGVAVIAAGSNHTCAITTLGGVKCWGRNTYGQLGDGSTADRHTPVGVSNLTNGVTAIAIGESHACAITASGGIKCWGSNDYGQLGDNTTTRRLTPVDVSSLTGGVAAIAAGSNHTCAVTTLGGVKCWGRNTYGQLGDSSTVERHTPGNVSNLTGGITTIAAGASHSCAINTSGGVKCWGLNDYGQLGEGTTTQKPTAVNVSSLASGVAAITAGSNHTCAITTSGGVKCWGKNTYGQLGDNSFADRHTPVNVSNLSSGVTAIAMGESYSCAITTSGSVKCWGSNDYGQLGDSTTSRRLTPVSVSGLPNGDGRLAFVKGWNLAGNSVQVPLEVASNFGDASKVISVWKWMVAGTTVGISYPTWAYYSPTQNDGGQAFARSKGYDSLATINGGEGFWVKAESTFSIQIPAGSSVAAISFQELASGWHLISSGTTETPGSINANMGGTQLSAGGVPLNLKSLWAWDNAQSKWYFYAPGLEAKGGTALADFVSNAGYLDFTTANKRLGAGVGFWVNKP